MVIHRHRHARNFLSDLAGNQRLRPVGQPRFGNHRQHRTGSVDRHQRTANWQFLSRRPALGITRANSQASFSPHPLSSIGYAKEDHLAGVLKYGGDASELEVYSPRSLLCATTRDEVATRYRKQSAVSSPPTPCSPVIATEPRARGRERHHGFLTISRRFVSTRFAV